MTPLLLRGWTWGCFHLGCCEQRCCERGWTNTIPGPASVPRSGAAGSHGTANTVRPTGTHPGAEWLGSLLRLLRGGGGVKGAESPDTVTLAARPALKDAVASLEHIDDSVCSPRDSVCSRSRDADRSPHPHPEFAPDFPAPSALFRILFPVGCGSVP